MGSKYEMYFSGSPTFAQLKFCNKSTYTVYNEAVSKIHINKIRLELAVYHYCVAVLQIRSEPSFYFALRWLITIFNGAPILNGNQLMRKETALYGLINTPQ